MFDSLLRRVRVRVKVRVGVRDRVRSVFIRSVFLVQNMELKMRGLKEVGV